MSVAAQTNHCASSPAPRKPSTIALDVLPARPEGMRKSKNGPRRAAVLIGVHLLVAGHLLHWWWKGKTISPVEPSEAMYTLNQGHLNAGFIFFAVAILATLVLGRFFCGWGCHLVAYQDFCGWLMKKIGVKPKPFRSRFLFFAPLALALYMFVWPTVYRVIAGVPAPELTNHLMTEHFWKTFPGAVIAIITFAICGFGIVYVLGAKGFCTYACPYGGFFAEADKVAPGRIRVTDDCEQCGHCTAVCTSNVRVHEEVAKFGMVVDPGCMKCMDCVSVCPNDALYFGFVSPLAAMKAKKQQGNEAAMRSKEPKGPARYDFTLAEEVAMAVVGLGALLTYRALYGQIPLLLSMGMAAITSFLFIKFTHLVRQANVKLQNKQFKRGGRITRAGWIFATACMLLFVFTAHSAAVQLEFWRGRRAFQSAQIGDEVWTGSATWWHSASPVQRERVDRALAHFDRGEKISLMATPGVLQDRVWLHLAHGDVSRAETSVRRLLELRPDEPEAHRGLAGVLRLMDRPIEAEAAYRKVLELDVHHDAARSELAGLLASQRRLDDALIVLEDARSRHVPRLEAQSAIFLGQKGLELLQSGDREGGMRSLRAALERNPDLTQARYNLAMALLSIPEVPEATQHLERVVKEKPQMAEAHYNLAVAVFMSGRPAQAIPHAQEALRLAPADQQAKDFLTMLQHQQ